MAADADDLVRRRPVKSCGKACFGSETAARRSMRSMQNKGKDDGYKGRAHAYLCRKCSAWHVGHR